MINKFKIFAVIAGIFTAALTFAQTATPTIKGSPYIDEAYVDGVISLANTDKKVAVRYNAFKDLIEFRQDGTPRVLDPTTNIKKVQFGTSTYVVEKFEDDGKAKYGYFELLDSGKVVLYAKKAVRYLAPQKGRALDGGDQPAEFRRLADTYFFKTGDGTLQEIKSIKTMIASLPDKQDELTAYAKKEKISPRKQEELLQLVKYYNGL